MPHSSILAKKWTAGNIDKKISKKYNSYNIILYSRNIKSKCITQEYCAFGAGDTEGGNPWL